MKRIPKIYVLGILSSIWITCFFFSSAGFFLLIAQLPDKNDLLNFTIFMIELWVIIPLLWISFRSLYEAFEKETARLERRQQFPDDQVPVG